MPKSRNSSIHETNGNQVTPPHVIIRHVVPSQVSQLGVVQTMQQVLSDTERARLNAFTQDKHRHAYLVSHALKRHVLAQILGIDAKQIQFNTTKTGKPMVQSTQSGLSCHFNLSHALDKVVVAVSRQPLGIDVESTTRNLEDLAIAKRFFAAQEYAHIAACPPEEQKLMFFKYWTLKEAYLKAEGWGLSKRLDAVAFDVSSPITMSVLDSIAEPSSEWRFWQTTLAPSHLLSVAYATTHATEGTVFDCREWLTEDWESEPTA